MVVTIRSTGARLKRSEKEEIEHGLRFNLTRYEGHVGLVDLGVEETTVGTMEFGYRVRVRLQLRSGERVAIEDTQRLRRDAIDRSIGRAVRVVRQRLQRPRHQALRWA